MKLRQILGVVGLLTIFIGGCAAPPQPYVTKPRLDRGLVIVLPGIEGRSVFNEEICRGLDLGGVDSAIELYDWTSGVPLGFIWNLWSNQRNHRQAADISERIARYQANYPDRPVVLVGQSGGGALAAWTCEAMRWGRKVDGVVMLAVALSPGYRLTTALDSTDRGIINFYSSRDVLLLWAGTKIYGTMDGKHSVSAGNVGFSVPPGKLRPMEYDKLYQVPWRSEMAQSGHLGMHLTSGMAGFIARYVAPLVKARQWDQKTVDGIIEGNKEPIAKSTTNPRKSAVSRPAQTKGR
ncbi:MAG: alpha/beta hydrolase [bacterium]|nr:alpha/beta hydrolase [bacterium]